MASKKELTLKVKVSRGLFANERRISLELPDGRTIAAFVDKRDVIVDRDPQAGEEVKGRVKVSMVEKKNGTALVDLPQPRRLSGKSGC